MEARGKYDFDATTHDELSFKKDDILKILSSEDEWFKAEMNGQEGFVPQNYVERQIPSWFQERASRSSAEEQLRRKNVGAFLIRACQSRGAPGDFSISVKHENDVQHLKVMKDSRCQYFLWSEKFSSLNKLVEFYKTTSIFKTREIYLNDGSLDCKNPPNLPPAKRGSLPEQGSGTTTAAAMATTPRRASDQPHNQLAKHAGLEERAHTIGHTGRSSPVSKAFVPRRMAETMPSPQRAATVQVKALYDFRAEEDDELGFCAGDIIEVLDHSHVAWWKGTLRGDCGLFPANYTSPM